MYAEKRDYTYLFMFAPLPRRLSAHPHVRAGRGTGAAGYLRNLC